MFEVRGKGKYLPRWMGDGGNFSAGVEFEWVRDRVAVFDSTAAALVRPGAKAPPILGCLYRGLNPDATPNDAG